MKPLAHIIYTPFTGVGLHGGFRGNTWFKHRIEVFKNYTFKSLKNQSNDHFLHWFSFRAEEMHHPYVRELARFLTDQNYPFIFTFDGLMYWDDKFNSFTLRSRLRNLLMMIWDCWKYKEWKNPLELIRLSWENKNKTLHQRVARSLAVLKANIGEDYDWVYLTRIDSDDMFHRDAVDLIQQQEPEVKKALVFDRGYIFNGQTGQVAEWNPPTNPPFHTTIFPGSIFFNPERHIEYYGDFKTHEDVHRVFNCTTLDMNKYCVSFHGKHISTAWESPAVKKAYHRVKYGTAQPFKGQEFEPKGYCYTTSGRNISTHWQSHTAKTKNPMIGSEFDKPTGEEILKQFGIE